MKTIIKAGLLLSLGLMLLTPLMSAKTQSETTPFSQVGDRFEKPTDMTKKRPKKEKKAKKEKKEAKAKKAKASKEKMNEDN